MFKPLAPWPTKKLSASFGKNDVQSITEWPTRLEAEQGISFEEVVVHIAAGDLLDIIEHPNPEKYKGRGDKQNG